jgi:thioredoxin reductase (NADPH)
MDQQNEVTIIGAGPAGIAAAIYLQRAGFHPLLLEKDEPGGLLRYAYLVENYPGFPKGIHGMQLVELLVKQLHNMGVSITKSTAHRVHHKKDVFFIETDQGCFVSPVVLIATGTHPKKIKIAGAATIEGTHLFYDPFSMPLHRTGAGKRILVIGGGDIAFDYALTLLHWGHEVTIISRSEPTCLPLLYDRVSARSATLHTKCVPQKIRKHHKNLLLSCRQSQKDKEVSGDFILIACGRNPTISFLDLNLKKYYVKPSDDLQSSLPGLFFAGDVLRGIYRQVGVAVGDGIRAAMMIQRFLKDRTVQP